MTCEKSLKEHSCFKLVLLCGGPSLERGISLNSARSVMDHLSHLDVEILPLYVDIHLNFYQISPFQLYSNTPADFDFKLQQTATYLPVEKLKKLLKESTLVFSVIHGAFGEDGELQSFLEQENIPFIGNSSSTCKKMFCKHQAAALLHEQGFLTLPQLFVSSDQMKHEHTLALSIENYFIHHDLERAIVKPAAGGSSIGVYAVNQPQEALEKALAIFKNGICSEVVIEPFCDGIEFTVVVFENQEGEPVALIPTEVEIAQSQTEIFDYRKKYLPTNQAAYHTPPRFSLEEIEQIQKQAEDIFNLFKMRDVCRLDGWKMKDGTLRFTDFNPMSGLEQNSFLFRQASILGMTHGQALEYVLRSACRRYNLKFPLKKIKKELAKPLPVYVLFGNANAERQVSLMSGTNVWLKLLHSEYYTPIPFLYDVEGSVWQLPYSYALHHTVEEIHQTCLTSLQEQKWLVPLIEHVQKRLHVPVLKGKLPVKMTLESFLLQAVENHAFVFLALHGAEGENGTIQRYLEKHHLLFNGSSSEASALCMDKYNTGLAVSQLDISCISALPKKSLHLDEWQYADSSVTQSIWSTLCEELKSSRLIVKPRYDGCSSGIVLLQSAQDFECYCQFVFQKATCIPPFSFANQEGPIEMSASEERVFLFEPYIETDEILLHNQHLQYVTKEGWIELTVGVLEQEGQYHALNPSITLAQGAVLSVEEKFQGGTGINLTPPPEEILSLSAIEGIKRGIEQIARVLKIENYARIDIFFNRIEEKIIVIEANTLPALTPSTVIYHQALAEEQPLTPLRFLETLISSKCCRTKKSLV